MAGRWFVIQVLSGQEQHACNLIERAVKEQNIQKQILSECFVPYYQAERKYHGIYKLLERPLFPGYVIAITQNPDKLSSLLTSVPTLTRILGSENAFVALDPAEQALINAFTTHKQRTIRISRAVYEGDSIVVTEGPLAGREGMIYKINRRKGTVRIRTNAFGRELEVEVGLALVTKR